MRRFLVIATGFALFSASPTYAIDLSQELHDFSVNQQGDPEGIRSAIKDRFFPDLRISGNVLELQLTNKQGSKWVRIDPNSLSYWDSKGGTPQAQDRNAKLKKQFEYLMASQGVAYSPTRDGSPHVFLSKNLDLQQGQSLPSELTVKSLGNLPSVNFRFNNKGVLQQFTTQNHRWTDFDTNELDRLEETAVSSKGRKLNTDPGALERKRTTKWALKQFLENHGHYFDLRSTPLQNVERILGPKYQGPITMNALTHSKEAVGKAPEPNVQKTIQPSNQGVVQMSTALSPAIAQIGPAPVPCNVGPSAPSAPVIETDAKPILGKGFFVKGCVYPDSASDHAPLTNGSPVATWNIATMATDKNFGKPGAPSYGHKFQHPNPAAPLKESNADYRNRLSTIAASINDIFNATPKKELMPIQEVPVYPNQRDHLSAELKKFGLQIQYDPNEDQAFIKPIKSSYSETNLPAFSGANKHRFQMQCSNSNCVVNVHARYRANNVPEICDQMAEIRNNLSAQSPGIRTIQFVGDFNQSAKDLAKHCGSLGGALKISTFPGTGQSCANNAGGHNPENVDLIATLAL